MNDDDNKKGGMIMTYITPEIKKEIEDKLTECIDKVKVHKAFTEMKMPSIYYTLEGFDIAGRATTVWPDKKIKQIKSKEIKQIIELNTTLLILHPQEMIKDTVVHEFAHCVDHYQAIVINKQKPLGEHTDNWKDIMIFFDVEPKEFF